MCAAMIPSRDGSRTKAGFGLTALTAVRSAATRVTADEDGDLMIVRVIAPAVIAAPEMTIPQGAARAGVIWQPDGRYAQIQIRRQRIVWKSALRRNWKIPIRRMVQREVKGL